MNTKPIPAVLALIAGFVTCIMSFVQGIDVVVFAKRFVFVCLIFYVIGCIVKLILDRNMKAMEEVKTVEEELGEKEEKEKEGDESQEEAAEDDTEKEKQAEENE